MQASIVSTLSRGYRELSEKYRKMHVRNNLGIIMMDLMETNGGLHGYGIINQLKKLFNIYFSASTIYPTLNSLKEQGLVEPEWKISGDFSHPQKRFYLTPEGRQSLHASIKELKELVKKIRPDQNSGMRSREYYNYLVNKNKRSTSSQRNPLHS